MTDYKHTPDMGEISGFGTLGPSMPGTITGAQYEAACQQMFQQGVDWLMAHPDSNPHYGEDVDGRIIRNEDAKQLSAAVCEAIPGGTTGAMHGAVLGRLLFIKANGWDAYCTTCREATRNEDLENEPERVP